MDIHTHELMTQIALKYHINDKPQLGLTPSCGFLGFPGCDMTGQGRTPKFLAEQLEQSRQLDEFLI
ncbi:H-NS family nucleoid-associated regulatory protein [Aeromonas popoffii]|uniref:H-NS family nucleoid-associated regulatory protein n=1 Tax=Aeromonas popoffii TaxID=70856 RepID=UPI0030CB1AFD